MSTHEDWLAAKGRRDTAAYLTVRYLYNGMIAEARAAALEVKAIENEMDSITLELDKPEAQP
jgi:hypothetical protein